MSVKIAADNFPELEEKAKENSIVVVVVVREYNEESDKEAVEELERKCEIGQRGKPTLVTDLMGDPVCRVRHFPSHIVLVAEYGEEEKEIVGVIRGCIKTVTRGGSSSSSSAYVKLAYLLGLRVSPFCRRLNIGTKLVQKLEEWCKQNGVEYSYMATDCSNDASINLFTQKFSYTKFRTPTMLVQPVHAHYKPLGSGISIVRLPKRLAESVYQKLYANSEFFPEDIDLILSSRLNLGTLMALPKKYYCKSFPKWDRKTGSFELPPSFAILSIWNTKEVFKLQLKGVSHLTKACCVGSRVLDAWMPWLRLPSFPDVFRKFGLYFLYGLHMEGKNASRLMKSLCALAHNMARDDGQCGAVVAEVGPRDPVREAIPHWRRFSWADLWCIKKLLHVDGNDDKCAPSDWIKSSRSSSSPVIFVDPRDF